VASPPLCEAAPRVNLPGPSLVSGALLLGAGNAALPAMPTDFVDLLPSDIEQGRFRTACTTLQPYAAHFRGRRVLDYGCSYGVSAVVLRLLGAASVVGVEPAEDRVSRGTAWIATAGIEAVTLEAVPDTRHLPFPDGAFQFALANAVFEHIPQPRAAHLRELWRVLAPGGVLLINETPNSYYPFEGHTTQLWGNAWLPEGVAYRRAVRRGRYRLDRGAWRGSGWRGMGWHELRCLRPFRLVPETSRVRHRFLTGLGLPASLVDPYPTWVLVKR